MKFLRFTINDDVWNWYIVPDDDHTTIDDPDAEAETDYDQAEVFIREKSVNKITVFHELWHCHMHYTFTDSAALTARDMEEVSAEFFSYRGEHIVAQGKRLLQELETLRDTPEED